MTIPRYQFRLGQTVHVAGETLVWRIVRRHVVHREPLLPDYIEYLLEAPNGVWRVEVETDLVPLKEDTP